MDVDDILKWNLIIHYFIFFWKPILFYIFFKFCNHYCNQLLFHLEFNYLFFFQNFVRRMLFFSLLAEVTCLFKKKKWLFVLCNMSLPTYNLLSLSFHWVNPGCLVLKWNHLFPYIFRSPSRSFIMGSISERCFKCDKSV